jgi:hypothetical protein
MFFVASILFLLACNPEEDACQLPDFENQWLQIYFYGEPVTNCYNFLSDGHLLMSDGFATWPSGRWSGTTYDCYVTADTDIGMIDVYSDTPCFFIVSEIGEFEACECSYEM